MYIIECKFVQRKNEKIKIKKRKSGKGKKRKEKKVRKKKREKGQITLHTVSRIGPL